MSAESAVPAWPSVNVTTDGTASRIEVPEMLVECPDGAPARWRSLVERWWASPRDSASSIIWEEFEALILSERYGIPSIHQKAYAFSETFAGLTLERQGLTCYRSAKLFSRKGRQIVELQRKKNTEAVKAIFESKGLPWPRTVQPYFDASLKSPDLTAYDQNTLELRFCEVKREYEEGRQFRAQINGLAALHLITRSPVAILRLVRKGSRRTPQTYTSNLNYTGPALSHTKSR